MEDKRPEKVLNPPASGRKSQEFVEDVKAEIGKITWTSPEELKTYTKIVVWSTAVLGVGLYCIDIVIQGVLQTLSALVHMIS